MRTGRFFTSWRKPRTEIARSAWPTNIANASRVGERSLREEIARKEAEPWIRAPRLGPHARGRAGEGQGADRRGARQPGACPDAREGGPAPSRGRGARRRPARGQTRRPRRPRRRAEGDGTP